MYEIYFKIKIIFPHQPHTLERETPNRIYIRTYKYYIVTQ